MLITVSEIVASWKIKPNGVLHIGAHEAEESAAYRKYSWGPVIWVEANPDLIGKIKAIVPVEDQVVCAALWDKNDEELSFNIADNGESSSLLEPLDHLTTYPLVQFNKTISLQTKRLDSLFAEIPNFLNLDVQGAELKVLLGLGELINFVDFIYTEVNERELYLNCVQLEDLERYLEHQGFRRLCMRRAGNSGWGDAFYARKELGLTVGTKIALKTFRIYATNRFLQVASRAVRFLFPKSM